MKKLLTALAACAAFSAQAETLNVAATPVPHAEILEFVKPALAKEGVELKVRVFTDYVQPNLQVQQKNLDANFFQHQPYLDEFNASRKTELVGVVGVHVEPFGAYSSKVKNLGEHTTVPVAQIRELAGVAAHDGRLPLFFTSGTYSAGGVAFADRAGMGLFEYRAEGGVLRAANERARAFVADPRVLVADEPTGDLDAKSAHEILDLLVTLNREFHKTIVMVTHDPRAAERAHSRRHLEKGVLVDAQAPLPAY